MDIVWSVAAGTILGASAGVLSGILLPGRISRVATFFVVGVEIYGAIAFMIWLLIVRRRGATFEELGLRRVTPGALVLMIPVTLLALYMNGVVSRLTAFFFGDVPTARDQLALGEAISGADLVLLLILTALVAPIVEEVIFRGLLYRVVRARRGVAAAAIVSALAFAMVHFIPLLVGVFFVFGLILSAVAQRYESLYPAIALHSLNNAAVVGLLYVVG